MAATYAEFLKANGARDEDIAILDTPVGRQAYERLTAANAESERLRAIAETDRTNYQKWYEEQALPAYNEMQTKVVTSAAELARARAAVLAAQEQGMSEVAKSLGWTTDNGGNPIRTDPNPAPAADTTKFVTTDALKGFMDQAGEGLSALQDMVAEHSILFPGQRLSVTELRRAAVAAHKNIVQFWEEKYNVPAARTAAADREKSAYETKLREEGAAKVRAEYAAAGNPELRTMVPSHDPFTRRPDRAGENKQPWDNPDATRDRVARATQKLLSSSQSN